jgi:hypothetical protein
MADLFRQSVYSRLAGHEDVNDAERVSADPTFRPRHSSWRFPPDWKGHRPLFMGTSTIPTMRCQEPGRDSRRLLYTLPCREAKMEIQDYEQS